MCPWGGGCVSCPTPCPPARTWRVGECAKGEGAGGGRGDGSGCRRRGHKGAVRIHGAGEGAGGGLGGVMAVWGAEVLP